VKVLEGIENLEAPNDEEKGGVATFGTDEKDRLLCQAKIKKGKIVVEY
jgi:ferredoxin